jgi:hypothetical protein
LDTGGLGRASTEIAMSGIIDQRLWERLVRVVLARAVQFSAGGKYHRTTNTAKCWQCATDADGAGANSSFCVMLTALEYGTVGRRGFDGWCCGIVAPTILVAPAVSCTHRRTHNSSKGR